MVDSLTIIMFAVPLVIAIIFTLLSIMSLKDKQADVVGFFSSLVSAVCWFIFSLTWSGIATSDIFLSVSYLWMALGYIFSIITLYVGMKMLVAIFGEKPTKPLLQMTQDDEV
jgi:signal transduction histidine kinase